MGFQTAGLEQFLNTAGMPTRVIVGNEVVYANPAFLELLGIEDKAVAHEPWQNRVVAEDVPRVAAEMESVLTGRQPNAVYEYRMLDTGGKTKVLKVSASTTAIDISHGVHKLWSRISTWMHLAGFREYESTHPALLELIDDVTAPYEAAERYLAAMAHELRTPLSAIMGSASLIERLDGIDPAFMRLLMRIKPNAQQMADRIKTWMDLARIERTLVIEDVNLTKMVYGIMGDIESQKRERRISLYVQEGVRANCDREFLEIVLRNLLSNAWKYTGRNEGASTIEFRYTPYQGPNPDYQGMWTFSVRDNGTGFNQSEAPKLFGFGGRLHTEAQFKGNGIGLNTARKLIERHGGAIWAEGEVGKGATFYFTLPQKNS